MITKIVIWLFQVNIHLNVTINKNMKIDFSKFGAENGVRTRDPQLGRLMLYQLSYFRMRYTIYRGRGWTRTTEDRSREIYSLLPLPLGDTPFLKSSAKVGFNF